MIHTLPYQSDDLFKSSYYKLRYKLDPKRDVVHLTVAHSHLQYLSHEEIYKKVLRLEGKYRTETNCWTSDLVRVRIVNQL